MRTLIIVLALAPGIAIAAEQQKWRSTATTAEQQKKVTPQTGPNPCAQYGDGFVQLKGSTTCVKLSGSIRVEIGR